MSHHRVFPFYCSVSSVLVALLGVISLPSAAQTPVEQPLTPDAEPVLEYPIFSRSVEDRELFLARVFEEPLVPTGPVINLDANPDALAENNALAGAVTDYLKRGSNENVSAITNFLNTYPESRWRGSLQLNLGIVYRLTGRYSRAFEAFEDAWQRFKSSSAGNAKLLGDRALAELAELNARVGRRERLGELISEASGRQVAGSATERLVRAREGLWGMRNTPDKSFLCGPAAVRTIQQRINPAAIFPEDSPLAKSTEDGTSLKQIRALTQEIGVTYQMAKRAPGSAMIVPSVVHWKVGHFGAITDSKSDRYLIDDKTFHHRWWASAATIDDEGSGYFLVPEGQLPAGWTPVSESEASGIWGKGDVGGGNPDDITPDDEKAKDCLNPYGMADYNFHLLMANITISDVPLAYSPPYGPGIAFLLTYNHREAAQPQAFNYFNVGRKWTCNWLCYLKDDPNNEAADVQRYSPAGGQQTFTGFNPTTDTYGIQYKGLTSLKRTSSTSYELTFPDGSKEVFARPDGLATFPRKVFMTKRVDPVGNEVVFNYDPILLRITSIAAAGQVTTISYEHPSDPLRITKVTDPFGRFATLEYTTEGRLWKIKDTGGLVSQFTYGPGDFINKLTTPYGDTLFEAGEGADSYRWCEATDPMGKKERVEFKRIESTVPWDTPYVPSGTPISVATNYYQYRNSFYWDKKAMDDAPGDFNKAHIYHWLHAVLPLARVTNVLESEKPPLQGRIWYLYPGQYSAIYATGISLARPSTVARVVESGAGLATQIQSAAYNAQGNVTQIVDPLGRMTKYYYDPTGIDLLSIKRVTFGSSVEQPLVRYTYNGPRPHLPDTMKDPSGNVTTFTYTTRGQVSTVKNDLNQTTTFTYDGSGYLWTVDGPLATGDVTSFTYDAKRNVRTVTGPDGYTLTFDIDDLQRVTKVIYPDNTYEQVLYDRLSPQWTRDRLGKWTLRLYNAVRQLVAIQDPLNRMTQMEYCGCGALRMLVDGGGRRTQWFFDLAGRPTAKLYEDGTANKQVESYAYEPESGRLKTQTDPDGRMTQITYNLDGTVSGISYTGPIATPSVSFTYDPTFARVATMLDGTGTTTYTYKNIGDGTTPSLGRGLVSNIHGPVAATVSYDIDLAYDALNRLDVRTMTGENVNYGYDALGRVSTVTNTVGYFAYNYVGGTNRLDTVTWGATAAATKRTMIDLDYFTAAADFRLKQIRNTLPNVAQTLVSQFDYTYRPDGQIDTWTIDQQLGGSRVWKYGYDQGNQIVSATKSNVTSGALEAQFGYRYDLSGNRTVEQSGSLVTTASFNSVNQMTGRGSSGSEVLIKGTLNEPGTVTVAGRPASVDAANKFEVWAPALPGANSLPLVATDGSGNTTSKTVNLTVTGGTSATHTFDKSGNMLTDGQRTYTWDSASRLVKIVQGATTTEFSYDGLGRRISEKVNGNFTKRWVWHGLEMVQERDGAGALIKRFYPQGYRNVTGAGVDYMYYRDHLGSIREMSETTTAVRARYEYDPYGNKGPNLIGTSPKEADFGFTGHYCHVSSGLHLAAYREYDSRLGRWLSRDPIQESGGMNLYGYVYNNPLMYFDPDGLDGYVFFDKVGGPSFKESAGHVSIGVDSPGGGILRRDAAWGMVNAGFLYEAAHDAFRDGEEVFRLPNHVPSGGKRSTDERLLKYLKSGEHEDHYVLYCSNYVGDALGRSGWRMPTNSTSPRFLMDSIRSQYNLGTKPSWYQFLIGGPIQQPTPVPMFNPRSFRTSPPTLR